MTSEGRIERRTQRVATELHVKWVRGTVAIDMLATNINAYGMFIETPKASQVGTLLQLEVALPAGPITMFVVVCFVGNDDAKAGMGVQVHIIGERERQLWMAHYRKTSASHAVERSNEEEPKERKKTD